MKNLYRYTEDFSFEEYENADELRLIEFKVEKETKCGFWIREHKNYGKLKFVLSGDNGKRFAYETKEAALLSFIIRKERQILHNEIAVRLAKHPLYIAKKMVI